MNCFTTRRRSWWGISTGSNRIYRYRERWWRMYLRMRKMRI